MDRRNLLKLAGFAAGSLLPPVLVSATRAKAEDTSGQDKKKNAAANAGWSQMEVFEMAPPNEEFLAKAEALKPTLIETVDEPLRIVRAVLDSTLPLGWRVEADFLADSLSARTFKRGDSFILDFGGHRAGNLSFDVSGVGQNVDAPVRLRLTFGEAVTDVAEPMHPFTGQLSEAWLPEEIVTIDYLPQRVWLPRRYAFRFVKMDVIDTSNNFSARFENVKAHGLSSAKGEVPPLPPNYPDDLKRIDAVAAATLRDCMQTVFEDAPRRDQRLWAADARLQALTSYVTFPHYDLVKRCLYLFAAFPRKDGLIAGDVFEKPHPHHGSDFQLDFPVHFCAAINDYVKASGDTAFGRELWPTFKRQIEALCRYVNGQDIFDAPKNAWVFIDWQTKLERSAAMHAVLIFGHKQAIEFAGRLGLDAEVAAYPERIKRLEAAAMSNFYDPASGVFVSGDTRQVSLASQAWMAIAGVGTKELRRKSLLTASGRTDVVPPGTPFLYFYVVEALLQCGLKDEALKIIRCYWGGMVKAGADTMWEAYSTEETRVAPYGDYHLNSFCHGWGCTPSYFFRKYQLA